MYTTLLLPYKNLIFQTTLSLSLSTLTYFISLPSLFLNALNTYIHPDDANPNPNPNPSSKPGPKIAIKRPNSDQNLNGFQPLSSRTSNDLKQRKKIKDKFEFDESKAQIFRLKLGDPQIKSRLFYDSFSVCFDSFVVSCLCLVLHLYLRCKVVNDDDDFGELGVVKNGSIVPILIGLFGFFRVLVSGFRVFRERSAFKRSERQLGLVFGVLGFVISLVISLGMFPNVVDFEISSIDGFGRFVIALISGFITTILYIGAGKNARSFWLGTDQIRCNLSIVSIGWFAQILLYANHLVLGFTSLLWITPFSEIFVNKGVDFSKGTKEFGLIDNVGMSEADFVKFRLYCLLLTGVLQVITLRLNVQTFLNEAVLSWYQRLHSSTIPDVEYSRAKVFLHNHYFCLAAVQFLTPSALILILLGLSRVDGGLFDRSSFEGACGLLPCEMFVKEVALFLAWWVAFVWFVFSTSYLAMYRRGILHIS